MSRQGWVSISWAKTVITHISRIHWNEETINPTLVITEHTMVSRTLLVGHNSEFEKYLSGGEGMNRWSSEGFVC